MGYATQAEKTPPLKKKKKLSYDYDINFEIGKTSLELPFRVLNKVCLNLAFLPELTLSDL